MASTTLRSMGAKTACSSLAESNAIYADGFLLFNRGDQLMARPFDPDKGTLSGELQSVSSDVLNDVSTWHTASRRPSGLLIFGNGSSGAVQLVWMDRTGKPIEHRRRQSAEFAVRPAVSAGRPHCADDGFRHE